MIFSVEFGHDSLLEIFCLDWKDIFWKKKIDIILIPVAERVHPLVYLITNYEYEYLPEDSVVLWPIRSFNMSITEILLAASRIFLFSSAMIIIINVILLVTKEAERLRIIHP